MDGVGIFDKEKDLVDWINILMKIKVFKLLIGMKRKVGFLDFNKIFLKVFMEKICLDWFVWVDMGVDNLMCVVWCNVDVMFW